MEHRLVLRFPITKDADTRVWDAITVLYPFGKNEYVISEEIVRSNRKRVREITIVLWATKKQEEDAAIYLSYIQEEYLKHLCKRKIVTDVLLDGNSLLEVMFYP